MPTANKGNLITRRAFARRDGVDLPDHRMKVLRHVVNKAMSTAYQMTEECGEFGSGRPSPLHMLCELIRELYDLDSQDGFDFSTAQEMADYPATFLRELRGEVSVSGDFICKNNLMVKAAAQVGYLLGGKSLKDLSPNTLNEMRQQLLSVVTLAGEMTHMIDGAARAFDYPGAPVQSDRVLKRA